MINKLSVAVNSNVCNVQSTHGHCPRWDGGIIIESIWKWALTCDQQNTVYETEHAHGISGFDEKKIKHQYHPLTELNG